MIKKMLADLNVPSPLELGGRRAQTVEEWEKIRPLVLKTMLENEYGYMPEAPEKTEFRLVDSEKGRFCGGKADFLKMEAVCTVYGEEFVFPFSYVYPTKGDKFKTFVVINFRPDVPDRYIPTEEIIDNGFACLSFCLLTAKK